MTAPSGGFNVAPVNEFVRLRTQLPGVELRLRFRVHEPNTQGLEGFLITRPGVDTFADRPDPSHETQIAFLSAFSEPHPERCATQLARLRKKGYPVTGLVVVHNTMVEPEFRGKGMGRILYRAVAEALAARGFAFGPHDCLWKGSTSTAARKAWAELVHEYPAVTGTGARARPVVFGVLPDGSRSLIPRLVQQKKVGALHVRSQYFDEGMSEWKVGRAKGIARKAAQEFIMVVKSWTKDITLSAEWMPPALTTFYQDHGIRDADPAIFVDLIKRTKSLPGGAGIGQALFDRIEADARAKGVRVLVLVSKHFVGERSPVAFWRKNGFEVIEDALNLHPHDPRTQSKKVPLYQGDITLMARVLS